MRVVSKHKQCVISPLESNQPGAPLIAGSVVGVVVIGVLFSLILCVAFFIGKRKGPFTQKSMFLYISVEFHHSKS